ncbi:hypothetical protein M8J76_008579 [Diaphorina citri]|nr:hypothetical protein M8J76_008579 [Diaphorina citri]
MDKAQMGMDSWIPTGALVLFFKVSEYEECRFPGAPAHSSIVFSNETLSPGTVATYACERGFELLGPSRRVCDKTGQWMPEGIPFCGPVSQRSSFSQRSREGTDSPEYRNSKTTTSLAPQKVLVFPARAREAKRDVTKRIIETSRPDERKSTRVDSTTHCTSAIDLSHMNFANLEEKARMYLAIVKSMC